MIHCFLSLALTQIRTIITRLLSGWCHKIAVIKFSGLKIASFLMLMHQRGPGSYRKGWSMNIKKTSPGNQGKITSHGMVNEH